MSAATTVRTLLSIATLTVVAACGGKSPSDAASTSEPVDATSTTVFTDSPTSAPAAPSTIVAAPVDISVAMSGDTLIHSQVWKAAAANTPDGSGFDFTPMFAEIAPLVGGADLAICHLETPLVTIGNQPTTNPLYSAPTEIVWALKGAGYDRCSTASNHTFDKGVAGIEATVAEFEAVGMGQSGMARTPEEIEPRVFEVKGIKVSHLAYTYGFNGIKAPNGETWRSALIDPERIVADARKAREMGANVVLVSIHWGKEGRTELSELQTTTADAVTSSGLVDLIIGHAAHVVQPIQQVNGKWVVFGLSNLVSYLPTTDAFPANTQDGMIVTITLTVNPDGSVVAAKPVAYPTWVDKKNGVIVRDVLADVSRADLPAGVAEQLAISLERTRSVVGDYFPAS